MPLLTLLGQKAVGVTIGGTSQVGAYSSTGGITLERTIGGTSQIAAFSSTGGITLERALGGTSQLGVITSSGGIQVGDAVPVEVTPTAREGGGMGGYQRIRNRKKLRAILEDDEEVMLMTSKALTEMLSKLLH